MRIQITRSLIAASIAAFSIAFANVAIAAPFTDGSFESLAAGQGDHPSPTALGAWEVGDSDNLGGNSADEVYYRTPNAGRAHSGDGSITYFGGNRTRHELFQSFDTVNNGIYEVSFWTRQDQNAGAGGAEDLSAQAFDGTLPFSGFGSPHRTSAGLSPISSLDLTDVTGPAYTQFTFNFTADSATSTLVFFTDFTSTGNEIDIDDVSVTFQGLAPIPEPSTLALGALALLGLALPLRRRRARVA
jgi:hypothetical protein